MTFLQHFHTEFSNAQKYGLVPEKWLIGASIFDRLSRMALEAGKVIHTHSTILGLPYEIGATRLSGIELVTGQQRISLKRDVDQSSPKPSRRTAARRPRGESCARRAK